MATITVSSDRCTVVLHGPDEDGDYAWLASCGAEAESVQPIADAIANAETHVDLQHDEGGEPHA